MNQKGLSKLVLISIIVAAIAAIAAAGFFLFPKFSQSSSSQRNDFRCWPPSCSFIPNAQGKQMCEDWKAGKTVQWPECSIFSAQPNCMKLCEFEKKNNLQGSQTSNYSQFNQGQYQNFSVPFGGDKIPASDPNAGSVYIYISDQASCGGNCDKLNHTDSRIIRMDDMTGKNWISFGTFGDGVNQLHDPAILSFGPDGKLYIPDKGNKRIVRIDDMNGNGWTTFDTKSRQGEPLAVAFDSQGRIYIAAGGEIIRINDMAGKGFTTFGTYGSGVNQFIQAKALAIDSTGRIYITDSGNWRVVRIDDMTGKGWATFGGTKGSGTGQFENETNGVALDTQGRIYIADEHNNRIVRIDDMTGKGWATFGGLPNDSLNGPHIVKILKNGQMYILDTVNHRVVRIDDMNGNGWIAYAPYWNIDSRYYTKQTMEAPHGMFIVERK